MAEPLVFLPGMMCDARVFGPQIAELSADHCVTVAPVTQGERIEEIASGLLDQLPARFALAGASMGGIVAMELLRRAPDRITRIALMNTNPLSETPPAAAEREPQIVGVRTGRLEQVMREKIPSSSFAPGLHRAEVQELVVEMAMTLGADTFVRQSRALQRRRDQQGTLRKCRVPTLVLCGAHDVITPVKRHTFMAELIPYAELVVLEDAAHFPTLEAPSQTTQALRSWMAQPLVLR